MSADVVGRARKLFAEIVSVTQHRCLSRIAARQSLQSQENKQTDMRDFVDAVHRPLTMCRKLAEQLCLAQILRV